MSLRCSCCRKLAQEAGGDALELVPGDASEPPRARVTDSLPPAIGEGLRRSPPGSGCRPLSGPMAESATDRVRREVPAVADIVRHAGLGLRAPGSYD